MRHTDLQVTTAYLHEVEPYLRRFRHGKGTGQAVRDISRPSPICPRTPLEMARTFIGPLTIDSASPISSLNWRSEPDGEVKSAPSRSAALR